MAPRNLIVLGAVTLLTLGSESLAGATEQRSAVVDGGTSVHSVDALSAPRPLVLQRALLRMPEWRDPNHAQLRLVVPSTPWGVALNSGMGLTNLRAVEPRGGVVLQGSRQACGAGTDCEAPEHSPMDELTKKPVVAAVMSSVNVARQPGADAVVWVSPLNPTGNHVSVGVTPSGGCLMAFGGLW